MQIIIKIFIGFLLASGVANAAINIKNDQRATSGGAALGAGDLATTMPQALFVENPLTTEPVYLSSDPEIEKPPAGGGRMVGVYGRALSGFALAGHAAYLAQGATLSVLDLADLEDPRAVFSKEFRAPINSIDCAGRALYLGLPGRLAVMDIGDPARPRLHAQIKISAADLTGLVVGSFLFVSSGRGEIDPAFYDIRDPLRPRPVKSVKSHATFIAGGKTISYLAPMSGGGAPRAVLGTCALTTGSRALTTTQTLALTRETALTLREGKIGLAGTSQTAALADLTTPTRLILHNTLAETETDSAIERVGNTTVINSENGFAIYRGTDFDEPLAELQKSSNAAFTPLAALYVPNAPGAPLYCYALDGRSVTIHELSETTITARGVFPGLEAPSALRISGRVGAVYDAGEGLRLYDLKDPRRPIPRGRWDALTEACAIQIQDNRACIADGAGGLKILSLGTAARPQEIGHLKLATPVTGVLMDEKKAYLIGEKYKSFYTVGTARPAAAALRSIVRLPENPRALALLKPDIAAVADGKAGLQLIDTSVPERPHVAGVYETQHPCIDVAAARSMAFLLDSPGIEIVYCGKPAAPQLLSHIELPYTEKLAQHIVVNGKALYVLTGGGAPALRVIDISNPTEPKIVSIFRDLHGSDCLPALIGTRLILPWQGSEFYGGGEGIQVLDVANPLEPRAAEELRDVGGAPYCAAGMGKYLYVTMGFGGVGIFRME